jgi:lipopolysaccharide transport system permease protein
MIFPRHYLVASVILAQVVHFLFSIPILLGIAIYYHAAPSLLWIFAIPLILAVQFILTFGVSLIVSIANTYFRDVEYLVTVLINLVFWMTPIIYPMTQVPEKYRQLALLNPLTSLINLWRTLFMNNVLAWKELGIALGMAVIFLTAGFLIFHRLERRLDEVL